jgi:PilZ domain-containing protein
MSPKGTPDQRVHARYDVQIRVDWSTGRMFVSDLTTNISEGGVAFGSGSGPSPNSDVDMVLWLPGGQTIRATGHVVWSQDAHALPAGVMPSGGLRFTEMHSADRAMLLDYLGELARNEKPARGH